MPNEFESTSGYSFRLINGDILIIDGNGISVNNKTLRFANLKKVILDENSNTFSKSKTSGEITGRSGTSLVGGIIGGVIAGPLGGIVGAVSGGAGSRNVSENSSIDTLVTSNLIIFLNNDEIYTIQGINSSDAKTAFAKYLEYYEIYLKSKKEVRIKSEKINEDISKKGEELLNNAREVSNNKHYPAVTKSFITLLEDAVDQLFYQYGKKIIIAKVAKIANNKRCEIMKSVLDNDLFERMLIAVMDKDMMNNYVIEEVFYPTITVTNKNKINIKRFKNSKHSNTTNQKSIAIIIDEFVDRDPFFQGNDIAYNARKGIAYDLFLMALLGWDEAVDFEDFEKLFLASEAGGYIYASAELAVRYHDEGRVKETYLYWDKYFGKIDANNNIIFEDNSLMYAILYVSNCLGDKKEIKYLHIIIPIKEYIRDLGDNIPDDVEVIISTNKNTMEFIMNELADW